MNDHAYRIDAGMIQECKTASPEDGLSANHAILLRQSLSGAVATAGGDNQCDRPGHRFCLVINIFGLADKSIPDCLGISFVA